MLPAASLKNTLRPESSSMPTFRTASVANWTRRLVKKTSPAIQGIGAIAHESCEGRLDLAASFRPLRNAAASGASDDPALTNPTTGIAACCARAASGQASVEPAIACDEVASSHQTPNGMTPSRVLPTEG
jgi:hypothetical protein